jgi:hypothetical protein
MSFAPQRCHIFLEARNAFLLIHHTRSVELMEPIVLFGIQFTMSLLVYALIASWYVAPRLSALPKELALIPLVWVHAFRFVGGTILAPGAADPAVPADFRVMIGYGDIITAALAIIALLALHARFRGAIALVWLVLIVGTADTVNAIVQSTLDSVFNYPLGINWLIVTLYVPALIVSSVLILIYLLKPRQIKRK